MRITEVKVGFGDQGTGYGPASIRIGRREGVDLAEAIALEHPCEDSDSCDIAIALQEDFPFVAADLLAGATETPMLERVAWAHRFNGTAVLGEWCNWGDTNREPSLMARGWQEWSDWHSENMKQCEFCDGYSRNDSEFCGMCYKSFPSYSLRVSFHAYCGMMTYEWETEDTGDEWETQEQRATAAQFIRDRRGAGYPVVTLERGQRWEVLEPDDCGMVPDDCGILSLERIEA